VLLPQHRLKSQGKAGGGNRLSGEKSTPHQSGKKKGKEERLIIDSRTFSTEEKKGGGVGMIPAAEVESIAEKGRSGLHFLRKERTELGKVRPHPS